MAMSPNTKQTLIKTVGFLLFLGLLFAVFSGTTYFFRNADEYRNDIVGFKEEKELDMVYIGASSASRYWQPLKAWQDAGFTSYIYGAGGLEAEAIITCIKEVRKTQDPALFLIDAKPFQYYTNKGREPELRHLTDSLDISSVERYKLLHKYFQNRKFPENTDFLSYYLDIAKYHTNDENLSAELPWQYIRNSGVRSPYKGFEFVDKYQYFEEPKDRQQVQRAELPETARDALIELLDYITDEKLNVLFIVSPNIITYADYATYNTVGDIVSSYGIPFLNTNDHYSEIGLDFGKDFYDWNHVNIFGAEKFTEYLEKYICEHYSLPDHRGDPAFSSWDESVPPFQEKCEEYKKIVRDIRADVEYGLELAEDLRNTENFSEWYTLASDWRYMILVVTGKKMRWPSGINDRNILKNLDLDENSSEQMRALISTFVQTTNKGSDHFEISGDTGEWGTLVHYTLSTEGHKCSIVVDGEEFCLDQDGINLVVVDSKYRKAVDSIALFTDEEGHLQMTREKRER